MNTYDRGMALTAATALARFGLWWFEDICDPLDFATHARVAVRYDPPIAAGEALFSAAEAALLDRYAGLRRARDVLLFDPVHCYGLPGYLQIIDTLHNDARQAFRSLTTPQGQVVAGRNGRLVEEDQRRVGDFPLRRSPARRGR